ncbi:hypothetical protein KKC60_03565, partial [Patescibacteria group bacterium]|nr:hypothetical protein [Patescibacteria group bacterium]
TELIKACAQQGGYIVCGIERHARVLLKWQEILSSRFHFPITHEEFLRKAYYAPGVKAVHIDDADALLFVWNGALSYIDLNYLDLDQLLYILSASRITVRSRISCKTDRVFRREVFLKVIEVLEESSDDELEEIVRDPGKEYFLRLVAVASGRVSAEAVESLLAAENFIDILETFLLVGPKTYEYLVRLAKHYNDESVFIALADNLAWKKLPIDDAINLCVQADQDCFWKKFCSELDMVKLTDEQKESIPNIFAAKNQMDHSDL